MTDLTFTKDTNTGKYYTEFSVDTAGVLMMNCVGSSHVDIFMKTDGINPIPVIETLQDANIVVQLNITGVTYRVESETEVTNAKFV